LRNLTNTAQALHKKVVKAGGEMTRLMNEYELCGVEVVRAPSRADMSTWLVHDRPRRHTAIPPSPGFELTQSTDASNLSQITGEAALSDDYTDSDVSHTGELSVEERSNNTETGLPDTQLTDETYSPEEKKRKKKMKKEKKEKRSRQDEDPDISDGSGNSTQY
jgi:hypothetical protein